MNFDPKRRLVMATFKTVLGHGLPAGHPLVIVDEPSALGEIDEALANRLFASKFAAYEEDVHATPVETPEQERNRLAAEALRDLPPGAPSEDLTATSDLLVWQADDPETGKKAGQKVTKDDLLAIAAREGVVVEGDDNKADLIRKITERRAQAAVQNETNAGTGGALGQDETLAPGSTGPGASDDALTGADGDAHGAAGAGPSDEAE